MSKGKPLSLDMIILSYALREKKFMIELSKSVKESYFSDSALGNVFSLMVKNFQDPLIKEIISPAALRHYCRSAGMDNEAISSVIAHYNNAKSCILPSTGQPPDDKDFGYYLKRFKEKHIGEIAHEAKNKLSEAIDNKAGHNELTQLLTEAMHEVNSVNQVEVFDEGDVGEDVVTMWKEYEDIESNPDTFRGVLTGFPSLDNITNGFQGSELIIIAGMEGTGKSILMHNMGVNAWLGTNRPGKPIVENGNNILYFTLEMPRSNRGETTSGGYLNKRILSCVSQLKFEEIRKGQLGDEDKVKLKETVDFIVEYSKHKKFYVVDIPRGARVEDIEVKYLELREKMDIDLVIIDYLGIMAGAESDDGDWQAQGNIAGGLHELARSYNMPILTAVQLNRPAGNQSLDKQTYNNARVARSAMITQNANIVGIIGCRDNEHVYTDMPFYLTKMRDGQKGQLVFSKKFECMTVEDGDPGDLVDPGDSFSDFEDVSAVGDDDFDLLDEM